jgi:hypothetical protein
MSNPSKLPSHLPPLQRLSLIEAESICAMFKLYDINSTGRIPKRLAIKLLNTLGFGPIAASLNAPDMGLKEFLMFLDFHIPEQQNPLSGPMYTFVNTVGKPPQYSVTDSMSATSQQMSSSNVITPQDLSQFMESIGRPPILMENANLLLSTMLDYDDCSVVPAVKVEYFERDVTVFAKKNNLLKDLK